MLALKSLGVLPQTQQYFEHASGFQNLLKNVIQTYPSQTLNSYYLAYSLSISLITPGTIFSNCPSLFLKLSLIMCISCAALSLTLLFTQVIVFSPVDLFFEALSKIQRFKDCSRPKLKEPASNCSGGAVCCRPQCLESSALPCSLVATCTARIYVVCLSVTIVVCFHFSPYQRPISNSPCTSSPRHCVIVQTSFICICQSFTQASLETSASSVSAGISLMLDELVDRY